MAVALITHDDCVRHDMGGGHPESPQRLQSVLAALERAHLSSHMSVREAREATREEIERVHSPQYVDAIDAAAPDEGLVFLDPDTSMNPHSRSAALHAAGAVVQAAFQRGGRNPGPKVSASAHQDTINGQAGRAPLQASDTSNVRSHKVGNGA